MYPRYVDTYKNGTLKEATDRLYDALKNCNICPRNCRVNRIAGETGFCRTGKLAKVYSYLAHHGEEPPISGNSGSGTIFFGNCNLRCVYCQNYEFSQLGAGPVRDNINFTDRPLVSNGAGKETEEEKLASFCLILQNQGCHNINFVTPTHVIPQILRALLIAIGKGLKIPLVYNSSGYDSWDTLRLLDGIFDIYLPDARYADNEAAIKYSQCTDYVEVNKKVLKEMHRQTGTVQMDDNGIIQSGLIVRHLVLPNHLAGTEDIMRFIAEEVSPETHISLMSQYYPCYKASDYPELARRLNLAEYKEALEIMQKYGLKYGWQQDEGGLDRFIGVNIKANL